MTVLIVPDAMAPDLRRYVANNGRIYTTHAGPAGAHSLRSFAGLRTTQGGGAVPKIPCHPERPTGSEGSQATAPAQPATPDQPVPPA